MKIIQRALQFVARGFWGGNPILPDLYLGRIRTYPIDEETK